MSGTTRSMPNISSSGNIRPQSMTMMSSPYSNTYMFLPISPTPPSGMMRSWSAAPGDIVIGGSEQRQLVGVGGGSGVEGGGREAGNGGDVVTRDLGEPVGGDRVGALH